MVAAPECAPRLLQSRRAPARGSATDEGRVSGGLRSGLGKRGSGKRTQKEAPLTRAQQGCVRKTASFFPEVSLGLRFSVALFPSLRASRRPHRRRGGILRSTPQLVALRHTCTQTKRVRAPTQSATFVEQLHSRPRRSAMMQCEMLASACSVPPSRCWPLSLTLMGRRPSCHRPFWAASASCRRE